MQIGAVAKRIGLSVDAIRFYERNALLPRAARTEGGFRHVRRKRRPRRWLSNTPRPGPGDSNSARYVVS